VSGDSPYRKPERPIQLVTDEKVGAHIDQIIEEEMIRSRAAAARQRRLRIALSMLLYVGAPLAPGVLGLLWITGHETLALWTMIFGGALLAAVGLISLISSIPARSDPPQ
jgi:hypothetical protein